MPGDENANVGNPGIKVCPITTPYASMGVRTYKLGMDQVDSDLSFQNSKFFAFFTKFRKKFEIVFGFENCNEMFEVLKLVPSQWSPILHRNSSAGRPDTSGR